MKRANGKKRNEMREEYDLSQLGPAVRGEYYKSYREGTNVALLDPDIVRAFPTSEEVNTALRGLLRVAKAAAKPVAKERLKRRS
jgi:hypothetical protein